VAPAGTPAYQEQAVPWVPSPDTNIAVAASVPLKASVAPEYGLAAVRRRFGETPASTHAHEGSYETVAPGIVPAACAGASPPNPKAMPAAKIGSERYALTLRSAELFLRFTFMTNLITCH